MSKEYKEVLKSLYVEYPSLYKRSESNEKKMRILASFYNLGKNTVKGFNSEILEEAMAISEQHAEPRNLNDFYSILLFSAKSIKGFKKTAYPQLPLIVSDDYDEEFDINKWSKLVYKIYDAVTSKDMTMTNAIDYYADTLDKKSQEDFKFKQWIKHHLNGDNNKYANREETMKKESQYSAGLVDSFYYPKSMPMLENDEPVSVEKKLMNEIDDADRKKKMQEWRQKLDGAIRRIDKLIRTVDDAAASEELFSSLHDFNMAVQRVKSKVTASDVTVRAANKFKKNGFSQGHDILMRTAQDLGPMDTPEEMTDEISPTPDEAPADLREEMVEEAPAPASEDPVARVYENESGAKEGEYEKLSEDIDLADAIAKLEEVAARLSDRRVIRLLAEFDIMLDKIGIASMFPELAESQSKLIDGYSYALTRVTKMMGMLSSGKSLGEISQARKSEITNNIRKDVDKTFNPKEEVPADEPTRGPETIQDEFQEEVPPAPTQPEQDLPPIQ